MSLKNTDVKTPGISTIAKKFNLPVAKVVRLVNIGAKTEFEHNKNLAKAKQVARDHIAERPDYYQKLKKMEKTPVSMKEETGIGAVRGLGYVSGDPSGSDNPVEQYLTTNAMSYEDYNGNVLQLIRKMHSRYHDTNLGFHDYTPNEIQNELLHTNPNISRRIMKESNLNELSGGDSRDYEGGVSGLPKSAYRWNDIKEGKRLEKVKKAVRQVAGGTMVAANLATLGQVAGDAAEGRGSPKRSIIAVATAKPGIPGLVASGAHYGLKVKDFMRRRNVNELYKPTPERLGRYISRSAGERAEALKGTKADVKTWERKHHFIQSAFKKLTKVKSSDGEK